MLFCKCMMYINVSVNSDNAITVPRLIHTTYISSIVKNYDFIFTKLTRLLLEVPMILFKLWEINKFMKISSHK